MNSLYIPCPECGYELCFMDRRDLDECTMCSAPLPEEMKEKSMNIEVRHKPGGLLDSERMAIAKEVGKRIVSADAEAGTLNREETEIWLRQQPRGFDRIEWYDVADDLLLLALWRYEDNHLVDEFIIEFSGYDSLFATLFCKTEEVEIE